MWRESVKETFRVYKAGESAGWTVSAEVDEGRGEGEMKETLKVFTIHYRHVKQGSLAKYDASQSRKPLGSKR